MRILQWLSQTDSGVVILRIILSDQGSRRGGIVCFRAQREIPHKLTNVSAGPSTVLGIVSPAGFEGF
jgi:hypothetical protein